MIVGIVNMYSTLYGCRYLIHAIQSLGYRTHVLDGVRSSQEDIADAIKQSSVTYWIFQEVRHPCWRQMRRRCR
jgi:hypothetical protein